MATFKVVLDGIDLEGEHSARIAKSIQRTVLHELAGLDLRGDKASSAQFRGLASILDPVNGGPIGFVLTDDPPDRGRLESIVESEFRA